MTELICTERNTVTASRLSLPNDIKTPAERVAWLRERYMKNPRDQQFDDVINEVLEQDGSGNLTATPQRNGMVNETRGILVLGLARIGKTALIGRNLRRHGALTVTKGKEPGNVLHFPVSASPTLKGVATDILKVTGYEKVHSSLRSSQVWDMASNRLKTLGITVLWLDEAHHMLELQKERTEVLRRFKTLMQGDNAIALILSGIPSLAEKIQADEETDERLFRIRLGPMRTDGEYQELRTFILHCCHLVGLVAPRDEYLVDRLVYATNGSLGRSMECTHSAIGRALRRADGLLTLDDYRRSFGLKKGITGDGPFDPEPWEVLKGILDEQGWSV